MLRFFRFHAWYGKPPLDGAGFEACARNAGTLGSLSGERVRKELLRTLEAPAPPDALEAMARGRRARSLAAGICRHGASARA